MSQARLYSDAFDAYLGKCYDLAKTIKVISTSASASINKDLVSRGVAVLDDPKTWKYNLHAAGLYHETDKEMTVVSADTRLEMVFSAATLRSAPATKQMFAYWPASYYSLLHRYQDQEALILGSLYPCDLDTVVVAVDGDIVAWPLDLVEPQELSLIKTLDLAAKAWTSRWHIAGYELTSSLYSIARHAVLYSHLTTIILKHRLRQVHTPEVHSFHVREYFKSNYDIDPWYNYLTPSQIRWLYRNIRSVVRRQGQQRNFYLIIKQILTARGIPVSQYHVRQIQTGTDIEPQTRISLAAYGTIDRQIRPYDDILPKEDPKFPFSHYKPDPAAVRRRTALVNTGKVATKFLKALDIDNTASLPVIRTDLIVSQWLYLVATERYEGSVVVSNPADRSLRVMSHVDAMQFVLNSEWSRLSLPNQRDRTASITGFFPGRQYVLDALDRLKVTPDWQVRVWLQDLPEVFTYTSSRSFAAQMVPFYHSLWCFQQRLDSSDATASLKALITEIAFPVLTIPIGGVVAPLHSIDAGRDVVASVTGLGLMALTGMDTIREQLVGLTKHLLSYTVRFLETDDLNWEHASYLSLRPRIATYVESTPWLGLSISQPLTASAQRTGTYNVTVPVLYALSRLVYICTFRCQRTRPFSALVDTVTYQPLEPTTPIVIAGVLSTESNYVHDPDAFIPDVFEFIKLQRKLSVTTFIKTR